MSTFWFLGAILFGVVLLALERYFVQTSVKRYGKLNPLEFRFRGGDLLLNQSIFIRSLSGFKWGHVGIVFREPETGFLYVLDINGASAIRDFYTTSLNAQACRLIPLYRYLDKIERPVAVRQINREVDPYLFQLFIRMHWKTRFAHHFLPKLADRVFPKSLAITSVMSVFSLPDSKQRVICAQFATMALVFLGVLKQLETELVPEDFGQDTERLNFEPGFAYGPELVLGRVKY
jgi:hypothetical protein